MILEGMTFPEELWYAPEHSMWLREEVGGEVTLGLTDYGVALFGDIFAFTPPSAWVCISRLIAVWVWWSLLRLPLRQKAPIAGTVVAHNASLSQRPALINRDCYGVGWMIRLRLMIGPVLSCSYCAVNKRWLLLLRKHKTTVLIRMMKVFRR